MLYREEMHGCTVYELVDVALFLFELYRLRMLKHYILIIRYMCIYKTRIRTTKPTDKQLIVCVIDIVTCFKQITAYQFLLNQHGISYTKNTCTR
jgi:hypothetical protein